jgi:hypothetical protein
VQTIEYYVLTSDPEFKAVVYWLHDHNIALDIHLNGTRFSLTAGTRLFTEFMLRYSHVCSLVDPGLDLATGLPLEYTVD